MLNRDRRVLLGAVCAASVLFIGCTSSDGDSATGTDAFDGDDGSTLSVGSDGADGADGTVTADLADGNDTSDGADGTTGTDGTTAVDGTTGIDGVDGSDGPSAIPFAVDDYYAPSGFMGDGESGGLLLDAEGCPTPTVGKCHRFVHTPGDAGWAGVFWQYPANNWGTSPGLNIPAGAQAISFKAWTVGQAREASFSAGIEAADGFSRSVTVELTTEPQTFAVSLTGVTYTAVVGGFSYTAAGNEDGSPSTIYISDIEWIDSAVGLPGCTDPTASNYVAGASEDDGSCLYPVTFNVDTSCAEITFEAIQLSGPFCSWCADAFFLTDEDNDQIYSGTFDFAKGALEYKYILDGFDGEENLIGQGACAVITDGSSFANRQIQVEGATTQDDTFGQCVKCPSEGDVLGCTDTNAKNHNAEANVDDGSCMYDVTFNVDMSCSGLTPNSVHISGPFCSWCGNGYDLADGDGDGIWSGTFELQAGPFEFKYMIDEFAGQEDLIGKGACAAITDNASFANRQLNIDGNVTTNDTYGSCSSCSPGGDVQGCTDSDANNYNAAATQDDGSCAYDVTFNVDLSCSGVTPNSVHVTGPFCSWCGDGYDLTDGDGDGTWTGTFSFPAGDLEFKYMIDQFAGQEDLIGDGECAAITDFATYANRQISVTGPVTTNDAYGQCTACVSGGDVPGCTNNQANNYNAGATVDDGSCKFDVTFNVDMSCSGESPNSVHITGPFCSWCDNGFNLSDPDGDGTWSGTFSMDAGDLEFKYMINTFAAQEDLIGDACAPITDGASFANRQINISAPLTTNDTYGQCTACP